MADETSATSPAAQVESAAAPAPEVDSVKNGEANAAPPSADTATKLADEPSDSKVDEETNESPNDKTTSNITNGDSAATPASSKKNQKRKSVSGTPAKKLNRKKSMPNLHLSVKPGEYWYVQMKGYPSWPAIVCDEEMLPESLLSKRPVSAMRVDGTYREDFEEGGKNARDRRYPVMFLGTNEFAWQVNTELAPLDVDEIKKMVENNEQGKKSKALWGAYEIAAEQHDLDYFKQMLKDHETHVMQEQERAIEEEAQRQEKLAEKAAEKAEKQKAQKEKKEKKSKATIDEDGDVTMGDADDNGEGAKSSKKRKKSTVGTEEKTKIVLKGLKTSGEDEQPKPKKARKSKGPGEQDKDGKSTPTPAAESAEERRQKREKTIFYLRHKLQKGLVSRDKAVQPTEMDEMNQHLTLLESYTDLEPEIIKETKVNKLLKVILKLSAPIPRDEELRFRDRCTKLLGQWNQNIAAAEEKAKETTTNGVTNGKIEGTKTESEPKPETAEKPVNGETETTEEKKEEETVPETKADPPATETAVAA